MHTAPHIRKRVRRWYLVVQTRRLHDAGYTQKEIGQRLGLTDRTVRRWKSDDEIWEAALHAPDREAVGPPLKTSSPAYDVLQQAAVAKLARETAEDALQRLDDDFERLNGAADSAQEPRDVTNDQADANVRGGGTDEGHRAVELRESPNTLYARVPEEPRRGRYVGLTGTDVGNRVTQHEGDPSPLDITGELALTRAILERVALAIEHDDGVDLEAVKTVARLLDQVSRMVERVEKIRAQDGISRADFVKFCTHVGRVIVQYCTPEQTRDISDQILSFRI